MSQSAKELKTESCGDNDCPIHGTLSTRGTVLSGVVVSDKMNKTVVVQIDYLHYFPKFNRYGKRRSKIHAHNPPCIHAAKGDIVKIMECRPLSKTVSYVVVEKKAGV